MKIRSTAHIDLSRTDTVSDRPLIRRPWKDELIYFLLVDRFHDGQNRITVAYSELNNSLSKERLMQRFGGTFNGIKSQLHYIKNLGCTCIWLSPIFENYEKSYHGYAISNFLEPDPRFGTMDELKRLVVEAHNIGIRIVLDIIINHTADTWSYDESETAYTGTPYRFGRWNDATFPLPHEFRNPNYYEKLGAIQNWDTYPETRKGDIFELKKLVVDDSIIGKEVLEHLIRIYSYWIKETDIDGFRLDTVKHLLPSTAAAFCKAIHDYTMYLGKEDFFIVGEVIGDYKLIGNYIKPIKTKEGLHRGLDAVFDFPLHFILEEVVKGKKPLKELFSSYKKRQQLCLKYNKEESDFVVFADNHDQVGQEVKARIGFEASPNEVIATIGFLYFVGGIPCLYYGTEQQLNGTGTHDCFVREPLFDSNTLESYHFQESFLYRNLAFLASVRKGLMRYVWAAVEEDDLSIDEKAYTSCFEQSEVVYWSKKIVNDKLILMYNLSKQKNTSVCVKIKETYVTKDRKFEYVYGGEGSIIVDCGKIKIDLIPYQFVILELIG